MKQNQFDLVILSSGSTAFAAALRQDGKEVVVKTESAGQTRERRAEKLLVATSRKPNSDKIAIEKAGVELGEKGQAGRLMSGCLVTRMR